MLPPTRAGARGSFTKAVGCRPCLQGRRCPAPRRCVWPSGGLRWHELAEERARGCGTTPRPRGGWRGAGAIRWRVLAPALVHQSLMPPKLKSRGSVASMEPLASQKNELLDR